AGLPALQRGRYVKTVAQSLHLGIPFDTVTLADLHGKRDRIIQRLVDSVNPTCGVYHGSTFKVERMENFVAQHNLPWPRHGTGCLNLQKEVWQEMAERFPVLEPLHECERLVKLLRKNSLMAGSDGRSRPTVFPLATTTGRNAWRASEYIFAQPSYLRGLVQPP